MTNTKLTAKLIRIRVEQGTAGLFYATSPQLKGMLVAQPTLSELEREIPMAIRELYAACGEAVVVTQIDADNGDESKPWVAIPTEVARKALDRETGTS